MNDGMGQFGCVDTHTLSEIERCLSEQIHTTEEIQNVKSQFTVSFGLSSLFFTQSTQPEMIVHSTNTNYAYLLSNNLTSGKRKKRERNQCAFCSATTDLLPTIEKIKLIPIHNPSSEQLLDTMLLSDPDITQIYKIESSEGGTICTACANSLEDIRSAIFTLHSEKILAWEI